MTPCTQSSLLIMVRPSNLYNSCLTLKDQDISEKESLMCEKLKNIKVIIGIWTLSILILVSLLTASNLLAEDNIVYYY